MTRRLVGVEVLACGIRGLMPVLQEKMAEKLFACPVGKEAEELLSVL